MMSGVAFSHHTYYRIDYPAIKHFIHLVDTDSREALSKRVQYPLYRSYPISNIEDAEDFIDRYDEIFDDELISMIVNSDLEEDWSCAGYRFCNKCQ